LGHQKQKVERAAFYSPGVQLAKSLIDEGFVGTPFIFNGYEQDSQWLDRFFASYYRHRPVNATFIGVHEYDGRLPDFSAAGVGDTLADMQDLLARLADLHPTAETYYERYTELWTACRDLTIAQDLLTWPDFPIRYALQPHWAREAAPYLYFLFYRAQAAFNRPPVHQYLVTPLDPTRSAAE
jgi:hypothetical protein